MPNIVVVGSINMDLVIRCARLPVRGETIVADSAAEIAGGKGANQAVAAARAGGNVTMIGRVGDDAFADRLLANLNHESIDTSRVHSCDQCPSGIAIVAVEHSGENAITVVTGANAMVSSDDVAASADLIRAADILLVQLEIPLQTVREAIQIAKAANVCVILDPAPMPIDFPTELLDVDVVCPNQSEAAAIVGKPVESVDDGRAAISQLHALGARNAIITMAGQGALISNGTSCLHLEPFPVTAVDTTAAGDAFAGALAVRLGQRASLADAARFAAAAGALATTRLGAQPAMPSENDIQSLIRG